jgi:hypothetical protein
MKSFAYLSVRKSSLLLSLIIFTLISCQKDIRNEPSTETQARTVASTPKASHESAAVAIDWYKLQLRFLLERNSTLNGAYFGYIGIGLYESVRYGIANSVSFSTKLYQMPEMPARENNNGYNWEVSANAAMAAMLRSFNVGLTAANKASIDSLENAYNQKLSPDEGSASFNRSQAFGRSIALAVYNWYLTDKLNLSNIGYVLPPPFPGSWVPTPPAFGPPINTFFSTGRTFLAADLNIVAPPFPAAYSEVVNSDFYNIAKLDYDVSKTLTDDQKNIALFWVDQGNGIGYTPNGHELALTTEALEQTHASLAVAAEAYAKVSIAQRDALIVVFKSKYVYNLLRPVTYIRKVIDPNWLPLIPTPSHPEYPAAHSMITGAAMQALERVLGANVTVTDHTYDFRGYPSRTYASITDAGAEAGISRLYGGIHYLPSINIGLSMGRAIGNRVGDIKLHE